MSKVLLTGFDAFGGLLQNPSALLVADLAAEFGYPLVILPTSYRRADRELTSAIQRHAPVHVVMFGYAKTADVLRLERVARNEDRAATPDNDGDTGNGRKIADDGPAEIRTPANVDWLAGELQRLGYRAGLSDDAGGFVCNHAYYSALRFVALRRLPCEVLFVHVPGPELAASTRAAAAALVELLSRSHPSEAG